MMMLYEPFRILMFGSPGAGKGTASKRISEYLDVPHISTGNIIRDHVERGTNLGLKAMAYLDKGQLLPDQLMINLVNHELAEREGWILDGYPRTVAQAESFLQQHQPTTVIYLNVDKKIAIKRLMGRGRTDDTEEIIEERMRVYDLQTTPVIEYLGYRSDLRIHEVDGSGTIDEVNDLIEERLNTSIYERLAETEEDARWHPASENPLIRPDI